MKIVEEASDERGGGAGGLKRLSWECPVLHRGATDHRDVSYEMFVDITDLERTCIPPGVTGSMNASAECEGS